MIDLAGLGSDRPYVAWPIDEHGKADAGKVVDNLGVRQLIAQAGDKGVVMVVTVLASGAGANELRKKFAALLGDPRHAESIDRPRPLTGPFVVPKSWEDVKLGAEGFVVGDLRSERPPHVPLVLGAWPIGFEELKLFVGALDESKDQWPIRSPAHARTRLERLIKIDDAPGDSMLERLLNLAVDTSKKSAGEDDLGYAGAIRRCEQVVDGYEDDFRAGHDFTREQHIRIEQLLQELIMRKGKFTVGALETERLGLESRLIRLLDAQASRDASGALQRVLAALTALVLVPALVAGVFGANIPIPYDKEPAMRLAMFALMACGGVLSYLVLSGVRQSSADRALTFAWPGDKPPQGDDSTWLGRILFGVLAGGALDVAVEAWMAMRDAPPPGMETSTSGLSVILVGGVVAACAIVLLIREAMQRRFRAVAVLAAGVVAAGATSALLGSGVPWGLDGVF